jgi:hypothetical protein
MMSGVRGRHACLALIYTNVSFNPDIGLKYIANVMPRDCHISVTDRAMTVSLILWLSSFSIAA